MSDARLAVVSEDDVAAFARDGFLVRERFVDEATLADLRRAYDELISRQVVAAGDRMLGGITRQVKFPAQSHPVFHRNAAVARGIEMTRVLLGCEQVFRSYDMLIYKPPGHPHETPWHQDMAYSQMPVAPAGTKLPLETVQFWVALDDADAENGCMHFLAGYQARPQLPHRVAAGDPTDEGRLLEIEEPGRHLDLDAAVCAAIPAGGATLHSYGTPHFTPPNRSGARPRRAYIFNVATRAGALALGKGTA